MTVFLGIVIFNVSRKGISTEAKRFNLRHVLNVLMTSVSFEIVSLLFLVIQSYLSEFSRCTETLCLCNDACFSCWLG